MNIVLIVIDTLRYDHVGVNTGEPVHTPNLDRFAAGAWIFHCAFAATWGRPSAAAARDGRAPPSGRS